MLALRQEEWWNASAPPLIATSAPLSQLWNSAMDTLFWCYARLLLWPLATLYFYAPELGGFGGWGGAELPDICAQLTKLSAEFWLEHREECGELVAKRLQSFVMVFQAVLYFFALYRIATFLARLFYWKCLARAVGPTWTWRLTPPRLREPNLKTT